MTGASDPGAGHAAASGERLRSFLAITLAPAIHAALVRVKHELAALEADVRWVRDDALHGTVKFLGSVALPVLREMQAVLGAALRDFPACTVEVAGLGAFPSVHRPRVLWVGLESAALPRLAERVDSALAALGFAPEARPFQGHITLGRVRGRRGLESLQAAIEARRTARFGRCAIAELTAFGSDLRRDGAVYTKLWAAPFGGA